MQNKRSNLLCLMVLGASLLFTSVAYGEEKAAASNKMSQADIKALYQVGGFSGKFDSLTPIEKTINISNSSQATFMFRCSEPGYLTSLTDPKGIQYSPDNVASNPNITYNSENGMSMYTINSPIPGKWKLCLSTSVTPPASAEYGIVVFEDNPIDLFAEASPTLVRQGDPVKIIVRLKGDINLHAGIKMSLEVTFPDETITSLPLFDDGVHNDSKANDGVFSATFNLTKQEGRYIAVVNASGQTSIGADFQRMSPMVVFMVSAPVISFTGNITDKGIDANGNGLYEALEVSVPVLVKKAGKYQLRGLSHYHTYDKDGKGYWGLLRDSGGETIMLPEGPYTFTITITAKEIVADKAAGPYKLSMMLFKKGDNEYSEDQAVEEKEYTTASYKVSDFEYYPDEDGDGLTDALEVSIGTQPSGANSKDSDFDGVSDYDEVNYDKDPTSYNPQTDLNPLSEDTDKDGMADGWEILFGYNPIKDDGTKDKDDDGDGLTNSQEFQNNTLPDNPDTDADGLSDGDEVNKYGTNPSMFDSQKKIQKPTENRDSERFLIK